MSFLDNLVSPDEIISKGIDAIRDTADSLYTSDEEKKKLNQEMTKIENKMTKEINKTYRKELETKSAIIEAEAKSDHFITSNWRPITALVFVAIIANNYIIAPYMQAFIGTQVVLDVPPQMWELLKIMIGGYVMGKSGEVIAGRLSPNHDSKKEDLR